MAETNQEYIDQLITFIENTNDPDSITNVIVAVIFAFLNNRCKSLHTSQTETADNLAAEATVRASADNELRAAIAMLRRALDESEDGTFAQTVREDIRDIFDALTMLRDDQNLSQGEIDRIKADIESILGENASEAIENFNEILNFLEGVKDTDSLAGLLENIRQMIRDDARDLQSHEGNNKTHINVLSLADEEDLDDDTGAYVRPGVYRVQIGADDLQPDRDGDLLLLNVWGRWDYTVSEDDGTWSVPVQRLKINREGVWVQSGTYSSDNLYSHGQWQSLTSLLLTVKRISDTKADRTELSNILGIPTKQEIENIEPGIVTDVLRKTPQTLTPEEQAQVKQNLNISKMELFIDMWNTACGTFGRYNAETGFFELNGLTDITYEQALKIYDATYPARSINDLSGIFSSKSFRTNMPIATFQKSEAGIRMTSAFRGANVEVINLDFDHGTTQPALRITENPLWIFACSAKKILGPITFIERAPTFNGWPQKLEDVQIYALSVALDMRECSKLTLASVKYIITNAINTAPITITVHPDVYTKLTDETNTEWHQVLLDAADKNITFATV